MHTHGFPGWSRIGTILPFLTCTHEEASLSDGELQGDELECPLHGGAVEIKTGLPANFPIVVPATTYRTRVVGDEVQIGLPK